MQRLNYIQIALGAILVSFAGVFVKVSTTSPLVDGVYRMLFGGIILLVITLVRRDSFKASFSAYLFALLAGLLFGLDLTFWHQSIVLIGPGLATVGINLQVFFMVLIGVVVYQEPINKRFAIAIPMAFLGLYLLVGYEWYHLSNDYKLGLLECFIGMLWYTLYILALRKSQTVKNSLGACANLSVASLFSAVVLAVITVAEGQSLVIDNSHSLVILIAYGFCCQAIGWLLISKGLPKTRVSIAGFLLLFQPTLSMVWDIVFFHRPTPPIEILGAVLTLISIYIATTAKVPPKQLQETVNSEKTVAEPSA